MKLIPFGPGDLFARLKQHFSGAYGPEADFMPDLAAQIEETKSAVIVRWKMQQCKDIQVYVDDQSVKVMGIIQHSQQSGETRISYAGSFNQRVHLPVKVKGEQAQTAYRDGVLEVTIVKQ